jgi:hypothetical protein
MRSLVRTTVALTGLLVGSAATASASILFEVGPSFVQPAENLLFNGADLVAGPALTVQGATNQTGTVFNLTGLENLVTPASGQARVDDELETGFTSLFIDALQPDVFYREFEANLNAEGDGVANIRVTDGAGAVFDFSFNVDGSGQNFFGLRAIDGQVIDSILISTMGVELADVRQIRLGGITDDDGVPDVPEPSTLLLFGISIGVAGRLARRRQ